MALIVIEVLTSPSGMPANRASMSASERDRDADPADLPLRLRGVASRSPSGSAGRRRPTGRSGPGRGGSGSARWSRRRSRSPAYWRIVQSRQRYIVAWTPRVNGYSPGQAEVACGVEPGDVGRRCRRPRPGSRRSWRTPRGARGAGDGLGAGGRAPALGDRRRIPGRGPPRPCLVAPGPPAADDHEQVADLDVDALRDPDPLDGAIPRRPELVLHLHRLDDEQLLAGRDRVARRDRRRPATLPGMTARTSSGPPASAGRPAPGRPLAERGPPLGLDLHLEPEPVDEDLADRRARRRPPRGFRGRGAACRPRPRGRGVRRPVAQRWRPRARRRRPPVFAQGQPPDAWVVGGRDVVGEPNADSGRRRRGPRGRRDVGRRRRDGRSDGAAACRRRRPSVARRRRGATSAGPSVDHPGPSVAAPAVAGVGAVASGVPSEPSPSRRPRRAGPDAPAVDARRARRRAAPARPPSRARPRHPSARRPSPSTGRPRRNASLRATNRWNGSVVWTPPISVSSSARRSRSIAASRSGRGPCSFAMRLSYSGGTRSPDSIAVSTRTPGPGRHHPPPDATRRRRERPRRILGGDAHLDRVARRRRPRARRPRRRRRSAARPAAIEELLAHDVDARDELRHAVLHLEPRVDLEEPEAAVGVEEELAGRRVAQARPPRRAARPARAARGAAVALSPGAGASSTSFWCRRWREQSRSPSATTVPCASREQLDLDVPGRAGSRARGRPSRRRTPRPPRAIRRQAPRAARPRARRGASRGLRRRRPP